MTRLEYLAKQFREDTDDEPMTEKAFIAGFKTALSLASAEIDFLEGTDFGILKLGMDEHD